MLKHVFLCFVLLACSQLPPKRTDRLSILQGVTSAKEVEFSVVATGERKLNFELRSDQGEVILPDEARIVTREHSPYVAHKIIFSRGLGKDYNLYVFEGEKLVDQRLVGRGPRESDKLRIAVASCMNDFHTQGPEIWDALLKKNPEYLLLIGDNVYADKGPRGKTIEVDPRVLWDRYVEVRLRLPLYFYQKLIPSHAIWDDHDYGVNGGDETYQYRAASLEIFRAFWAQELAEESWAPGPGASGLLNVGDFNLYFLDGRSFRAATSGEKHLGEEQESWLFSKLKEQPGPSFLIKGDQFFGGYHGKDSFEGSHPKDFTQFAGKLAQLEVPFIFLSGDHHMSEIMQFPRGLFKMPSFEITSSPIQSAMSTSADIPNPWRVVSEKGQPNFVLINNLARDNHWFMDVESIGKDGQLLFRRELAVYIKDLQNNLQEVRKKRRSGKRRYQRPRKGRR